MFIRAVTGACLLSVMIASIWFGIYTVGAIILLISLLALLEFYRLFTCAGCKVLYIPGILTSVFAFLSVFLHATGIIQLNMVLSVCLPFCVLIFVAQLFSEATMAFESAAFTITGVIYIMLPLSALIYIAAFPTYATTKIYSPWYLLSFFILVWVNDTGAYLTGISIGKHKLFERISPKKTWEGSFGGLILSIATGMVLWQLRLNSWNLTDWLVISILVVIFGNLGDLTESALKRNLGLKDSGGMLPGHGGLLDRFDGVLFSAPMVVFYLIFVKQFL